MALRDPATKIKRKDFEMGNIFDTTQYGSVFAELIGERRLNPLDPGSPNGDVRDQLDVLSVQTAFEGQSVVDEDMAQGCISAVWLYHNFLDESHTLSQNILTETGSYWHGIMHRREPDFSNSKYWFRKVGDHPVFEDLVTEAIALAEGADDSAAFLSGQKCWDPFAFVDLCESALSGAPTESLCREIQLREWELLFDFSYRKALGK